MSGAIICMLELDISWLAIESSTGKMSISKNRHTNNCTRSKTIKVSTKEMQQNVPPPWQRALSFDSWFVRRVVLFTVWIGRMVGFPQRPLSFPCGVSLYWNVACMFLNTKRQKIGRIYKYKSLETLFQSSYTRIIFSKLTQNDKFILD